MPREIQILETAQAAFDAQLRELESTRDRKLRAVVAQTATGNGNIDASFGLDRKYRLVFVRCHFSGATGTASLAITLDSGAGSGYDAKLFTITQAGLNKDVHLRIDGGSGQDPSPWTFQSADRVRIQWTNPASGQITWGLEVGLALAS